MRSRLLKVALVIFVLWGCFVGFIYWSMRQAPETFGRVMSHMPTAAFFVVPFETLWMHARAGTLNHGDHAPDFSLEKLDHTGKIMLSALNATQPVVLIFGSYT